MTKPEFSRPERLDSIGAGPRIVEITADKAECAALAERFGLAAIDRLEARFSVARESAGIVVRGHVSAAVTQICVVTDDPVPATVEEEVALRFVAEEAMSQADETELSQDDCDIVSIEGSAIDLGEAAAETMALALDPFPRAPAAEGVLREAGVLHEEDVHPAGAFAGLKAKLDQRRQG